MVDFGGWKRRKASVFAGTTAVILLLGGVLFVRDLAVLGQEVDSLATPLDFGGGAYEIGALDHISDQQRQEIEMMLAENMAVLAENGRLSTPNLAVDVKFGWPLKLKDGLTDPGYHGISFFVDQNPAFPNQIKDFACSNRTYDTSSGYNHRGTDFFIWPFEWNKMAADEVEIVAAAPGIIVGKWDGIFDRRCSFAGSADWNAVYIRHEDGSVAWYGHMKNGSVTSKALWDTVEIGEYLGVVGSSGPSTGPHLHFEVHDSANSLIDPYAGQCNRLNSQSWWAEQRPYYDSAVNKLTTGFAPVNFTSCPNPTITNERSEFKPGDVVYLTAYYRDQLSGQKSVNTIYRPDNKVFTTWIGESNKDHYEMSYWWRSYELPVDAPGGNWVYEVVFEEETVRHEFFVDGEIIEIEDHQSYLPLVRKDPTPTPLPPTSTPTFTPTVTMTSTATLTATGTVSATLTLSETMVP